MVLPTLNHILYFSKGDDNPNHATEIKGDFFSFPLFTDVGSGEVNHAILVLSADGGKYITRFPTIDGYDRIYVDMSDENNNPYVKAFTVILTTPIETKTSGTKLELQLVGIEHNIQKINFTKPFYAESAFNVVK